MTIFVSHHHPAPGDEPQDTVVQLLTSWNASNESTLPTARFFAPPQQLLAKQSKRILKRLYTRKTKG